MSTNRLLVSTVLVGLVGVVAVWWAWPERTAPTNNTHRTPDPSVSVPGQKDIPATPSETPARVVPARRPSVPKAKPDRVRPMTDDLQERCRAAEAWATSGTEEGVAKAIAAARAEPALREAVVRALGGTGSAKAAEYVAELLNDKDPAVLCAAIAAWAALKGEEAIEDIGAILEENRDRKDGEEEEIGSACVKALGEIRSSEALPVLDAEFQWVSQQEWMPRRGSELIEAVGDIGDSRATEMLDRYADDLQGNLSGDPTIRRGQMMQIMEARVKAEELR